MKAPTAASFPLLRQVFTGYLHEDFAEDYSSPAEALRAFEQDADALERRRFRIEMRRLREGTAPLDFTRTRKLLAALGCRWTPPSREALAALFDAFSE